MIRKFMMTVALGSLAVGGLAATHLAYAQDAGPHGGRHMGGRGGGPMAMADANKDGKLTKAELATATDARFAKMDVNKDGMLNKADRDARRAERIDDRFARLDADKNGQISKAEFAAPRAERGPQAGKPGGPDGKGWGGRYHRGGGHGKGMMGGGMGRGMMDGDKDGTVTKAEFTAGALAMFDRADADKDGTVTAAEQKAARDAMRAAWKDRKAPADK